MCACQRLRLRCGRYSLPETLGVLLPMARSVLRAVRYLRCVTPGVRYDCARTHAPPPTYTHTHIHTHTHTRTHTHTNMGVSGFDLRAGRSSSRCMRARGETLSLIGDVMQVSYVWSEVARVRAWFGFVFGLGDDFGAECGRWSRYGGERRRSCGPRSTSL